MSNQELKLETNFGIKNVSSQGEENEQPGGHVEVPAAIHYVMSREEDPIRTAATVGFSAYRFGQIAAGKEALIPVDVLERIARHYKVALQPPADEQQVAELHRLIMTSKISPESRRAIHSVLPKDYFRAFFLLAEFDRMDHECAVLVRE